MSAKPLESTTLDGLYDRDFALWCEETARLLQARRFSDLDVRNLIEEVTAMAGRDRREVVSRLRVLIAHLLEWEWQPGKRSRGWQRTIDTQRAELEQVFRQSPSLRSALSESVVEAYPPALRRATLETDLPADAFPSRCPYTPDQLLDDDFLPGETRGGTP